jgi:hypothetical protein
VTGKPHSRIRCLAAVVILALGGTAGLRAASVDGEALFESEIRPILASRCVSCHGPGRQEGHVRLDSKASVSASNEDGLLARTIRGQSSAPVSCVLGTPVAQAFDQWIALDLPWPESATVASASDRDEMARRHWAFQPVRDPAVPPTASGPGANPIDAFVLAGLRSAGLSPSPEADRRSLIRRLTYTLTGLPPSTEVVDRFGSDPDPKAYEREVERLLASEAYGEHWARHWLDVARYSDTKGYVYSREEKNWPHAWVYRDWVVRAMNTDLSYDRFLLLQVAADQVDDRQPGDEAAMGFLTLGRRFLGVKHDIIDDRIDVVTRGMLGLTVSCARCHHHKYDPIPTEDYYALHGVFDRSVEKRVPLGRDGDEAFWNGHDERQRKFDETMTKFRIEAAERVRERVGDYLKAQTELDKYPADGFDQIFQKSDLLPAFVRAWRDYLRDAGDRDDPVFRPWHAYAALSADRFAGDAPGVMAALSGKAGMPPLIAEAFATLPANFDDVIARYAAVFHSFGKSTPAAPDTDPLRRVLYGPDSPCEVPEGPIASTETYFDTDSINALWKLNNEIDRAFLNAPEAIPVALTLVDRALPAQGRVLLRGNPLTPGEAVPRHFPEILAGENHPPFTIGSGRLELARAIIDPANPLTSRVMVNRVWAQHFGTGLVDTPSDFGTRAGPPSHPELLDWLTTRFIEDGWSLKALHRRILLSATFRQSSLGPVDPDARHSAAVSDPGNRLLWRMTPHRLRYEEFHDSLFAASGELDPQLGGRPVESLTAPYSKRRALYGKVDRQFVPGVLRMFDFANPDLHIPQRNETTVPQQALFFLNHPLVLERARALAKVTGAEAASPPARVKALFHRVLQREPSETEIGEALALIDAVGEREIPHVPATEWHYGFGAMDETAQRLVRFTPLPHFTGNAWQGGPQWPDANLGWVQLTALGGHPGNDRAHAAVRRWTAPRAMTVAIESQLAHEPTVGDGIRAFVVSSRVGLLGSATLHARSIALPVASLAVETGETIDFVVDIGDGLNSDQFLWQITLADRGNDPEHLPRAWDSKSDFPANQTALLNAWEQLTQTILCSNEFLFVD